ncbi:MAG: hypothetical protein GVX78_01505 [Bacteroidetes bacterium]|jgi:D-alanyl-D-alanine carboxypeptidase/D-alanyl-D-alanine-endopeptidase (penicillin-binding protein 4)|nr:hypothetical protein [Bacteroidota bacterium]
MKKTIFYCAIAISVLISACHSNQYLTKGETKSLEQVLHSQSLDNHFQGLVIYDPESQQTVFEYQGEKLFTPASNTKILTLRAALESLPDSFPLYEQLEAGRSIYLRGTGHPALFHPDFDTYWQEASLQLMLRGFDSLFLYQGPNRVKRFGSGWAWDDYPYYYQAERSPFPIYGNVFYVEWDSLRSEIQVEPEHLGQFSRIRLGKGSEISLKRDEFINEFSVRVGAQTPHETRRSIPFIVEPYLVSRLWEDKMNRLFLTRYEAPTGKWIPKAKFPMDTVLRKMMWESDNFLAEQILLMVGKALTDTLQTTAAINAILPDSSTIRWVDGSGLSRYNLVSPAYLVSELEQIQKRLGWGGVQNYFPANGLQGTLKNRYTEKKQPYIYAKTGTLSNNYNLSGYILGKSGKWYIFSYMHNHFLGSPKQIQDEIEEILYQMHKTL